MNYKRKRLSVEERELLGDLKRFMQLKGLKRLPSFDQFIELDRSWFNNRIYAHGGFRRIRGLLGEDKIVRENHSLNNKKSLVTEANKLKEKEGWDRLPSHHKLIELGYSYLSSAIIRTVGTYSAFRRILGEEEKRIPGTRWPNCQNWKKYGVKKGFEKKSPNELKKSEDRYERGWYSRGIREEWLNDFKFARQRPRKVSSKEIREAIRENPLAGEISKLAAIGENTSDVVDILMKMYPHRFPNAAQLARELPSITKGMGDAVRPFTLEHAISFYDTDYNIPKEVEYHLSNLILEIVVSEYQPGFDRDPKGTLAEIKRYTRKDGAISGLAKKVFDYYRGVYKFDIPGHGKMKDAA